MTQEAMKAMAEDHLPLVRLMVRRFPWPVKEKEELYQQGCVGLMKAIARFDPACGTRFSTYAAAMILGEMRQLCRCDAPLHIPRTLREKRSRIRRAENTLTAHLGRAPTMQELAAALRMDTSELAMCMEEISVTSMDTVPGMVSLLPAPDDWMTRLMVRDLLDRLSARDRKLLMLRFQLGWTQAETAKRLGISQVQVSRRETALKATLRELWAGEHPRETTRRRSTSQIRAAAPVPQNGSCKIRSREV